MITGYRIGDSTIKFHSNSLTMLNDLKNKFDEENARQPEERRSNLRRASHFPSMKEGKNKSVFQLTFESDCLTVTAATWRPIAAIAYKYNIQIDMQPQEPDQKPTRVPGW